MMEADAKLHVLYCSVRDVTELRERSDVVTKLLPELERSNTQFACSRHTTSCNSSRRLAGVTT